MTTIADLVVSVGAEISGFTKGMNDVDNKIDNVSKSVTDKLGDISDGFFSVGKNATLLGAPFLALGVLAVKSAADSQKAIAQLDAVLKSTGGSAGVTKDKALALASSLQKLTTYSDESVLSAQSMLLTFTNIGQGVFEDTTKAVLDLSTAMGQDTKSSAIQLGKALNDPINGISALTRVGVTFTDAQKKQIEQLVKSGKTMEAQKVILAEINKEFGGSAEAAGKTFAGSLEILKNRADDLGETLGNRLIPVVQFFTGIIGDGITFLENLSEPMQTVIAIAVALGSGLAVLGPIFIGIGAAISVAAPAIAALGAGLALLISPIGLVVAALVGLVAVGSQLVNFDELGNRIATGLGDALNAVKDLTGFDALALVKTIKDKIAAAFGFGGSVLPSSVADKAALSLSDQLAASTRKAGNSGLGGNRSGGLTALPVAGGGGGNANKSAGGVSRAGESIFTGLGDSLVTSFQAELDTAQTFIKDAINLFLTGDFVGGTFGGAEEDSDLVSGLFTVRDGIVSGITAIKNAFAPLQNIKFPSLDFTGFQEDVTASFDGLDFSGVSTVMETHFNDILGTIVTVAGLVFGGPIGLAIGAAKLVATAINDNFLGIADFLDQSGITSAVSDAFNGIKTTIDGLIQSVFSGGGDKDKIDIGSKFALKNADDVKASTGPLATFISDLSLGLNELKNLVETVWANIAPGVQDIATGIQGFISNLSGTETGGLLRIVTAVTGVIGGIADVVIRVGSDVLGQALSAIGSALPAIGSAINDFITALSNLGEGDVSGFLSGIADTLIDIGQSILNFVGIKLEIPDFNAALQGWQTFADSLGTIVSYAGEQIASVFDNIAVGIRSFLRDIEETVNRAKVAFADVALAVNPNDVVAQQNKAEATTGIQGSETAKVIEKQLNDSLAAGDINIDVSKFITTDPAAIAAKIADPTLIQDALSKALAEGDENAINVLLPIATELGIDTQKVVDQFAASLNEAGAAQIYSAQLTADVLVSAGKVDLGPLRGAINAAIANGNLAGGVPSQGVGGAQTTPIHGAASGANIKSDGLVYAHTGEVIQNRAQQQAANGSGGNQITFAPSMSIDQMLSELERRGIYLQPGMNAA